MRYVMVCSLPECEFSKTNSYEQGVDQFCPKCGNEMYWKCPHCDRPLRDKGAAFCSGCGKSIKPPKSAESN